LVEITAFDVLFLINTEGSPFPKSYTYYSFMALAYPIYGVFRRIIVFNYKLSMYFFFLYLLSSFFLHFLNFLLMKKLINPFFATLLLLALGSCTKENSFQNSFSSVSSPSSALLCPPSGTVEIYYGVLSPTATVRITYDAAYTGPVYVRRNNSSGDLVTSGSVSLNPYDKAFVIFQLTRGKTYFSRLVTGGGVLCNIDNTFSIPGLPYGDPEPCPACLEEL
jgi:hypothetical protein